MNALNNNDKTDGEYSLGPIDDLIRFWRSKSKGQGHSRPSRWQRHPRRRWGRRSPYFSYIMSCL